MGTPENKWCSGNCWACSIIQQQGWVRRRWRSHARMDNMAHLIPPSLASYYAAHVGSKGRGSMPRYGLGFWSLLSSAIQAETPSPRLWVLREHTCALGSRAQPFATCPVEWAGGAAKLVAPGGNWIPHNAEHSGQHHPYKQSISTMSSCGVTTCLSLFDWVSGFQQMISLLSHTVLLWPNVCTALPLLCVSARKVPTANDGLPSYRRHFIT